MRTSLTTALFSVIVLTCVLLQTETKAEEPTHTLPPSTYCYGIDSAENIAREDAKNGVEAAGHMFAESLDCDMGQGEVIIVGVISTHKVKRNGKDKTLYVYEAKNPIADFYIISTAKLMKEDQET